MIYYQRSFTTEWPSLKDKLLKLILQTNKKTSEHNSRHWSARVVVLDQGDMKSKGQLSIFSNQIVYIYIYIIINLMSLDLFV